MKCIRSPKTNEVVRVPDKRATVLVKEGWRYAPKKEWKEKGRKYMK